MVANHEFSPHDIILHFNLISTTVVLGRVNERDLVNGTLILTFL